MSQDVLQLPYPSWTWLSCVRGVLFLGCAMAHPHMLLNPSHEWCDGYWSWCAICVGAASILLDIQSTTRDPRFSWSEISSGHLTQSKPLINCWIIKWVICNYFTFLLWIIINHSFIQAISIAPLQVRYNTEALPTQHRYWAGVSRRSATDNCELRTCKRSLRGG